MTENRHNTVKFMSLDGTVFLLRCRNFFDPILDRSLWGFLILLNTAFIAKYLLVSQLLSPNKESIHWTVQVFSFFSLSVNVLALLALTLMALGFILFGLVKSGLIKAIYVPFFYILPSALYGMRTWIEDGYRMTHSSLTIIAMFLIICACVDILYGRFGAKFHSRYVAPDDFKISTRGAPANRTSSPTVDEKSGVELPAANNDSSDTSANAPVSLDPASRAQIIIGKQSFFSDEIRWIESEDHYLNVHLSSDSVLLLGKLADAVAQLSQEQGVQINRSVWVAHDAIQSISALSSRKMFITLTDGETLKVTPMGRKRLEEVNKGRVFN